MHDTGCFISISSPSYTGIIPLFSMFNMLTPSLANQALCGWSYWSEHYKNFSMLISLLGC